MSELDLAVGGQADRGPIIDPGDDLPDAPVTFQLRLSPLQFARYEAIREKLHKLRIVSTRDTREEMFLDGLDALLETHGLRLALASEPNDASVSGDLAGTEPRPRSEDGFESSDGSEVEDGFES